MFRNGWASGDKRKPVTAEFMEYAEAIYRPIMCALLFGESFAEFEKHWSTFKSCKNLI